MKAVIVAEKRRQVDATAHPVLAVPQQSVVEDALVTLTNAIEGVEVVVVPDAASHQDSRGVFPMAHLHTKRIAPTITALDLQLQQQ